MEGVEDANASIVEVDNASNLTGRSAATAEGIIITYSALFAMALGPILIGSLRSVTYHSTMKVLKGWDGARVKSGVERQLGLCLV